jgi:uncharacterized membrane protein
MSSRTAIGLIAAALVLLILGLIFSVTALALIGLAVGVVVGAVWALAAGCDFIRDVSEGRFKRDGRS